MALHTCTGGYYMTLYRHFKLSLDSNCCLLKKIRFGCLQSVQVWEESHASSSVIPDWDVQLTVLLAYSQQLKSLVRHRDLSSQVMYTGIANRSHLFLKNANCNLGIKKETGTCHSCRGEARNNETIWFNLTDNCGGSSVPSSCKDIYRQGGWAVKEWSKLFSLHIGVLLYLDW